MASSSVKTSSWRLKAVKRVLMSSRGCHVCGVCWGSKGDSCQENDDHTGHLRWMPLCCVCSERKGQRWCGRKKPFCKGCRLRVEARPVCIHATYQTAEQEEEQVARELVHELWQKASRDVLRFKDHEARKLLNRVYRTECQESGLEALETPDDIAFCEQDGSPWLSGSEVFEVASQSEDTAGKHWQLVPGRGSGDESVDAARAMTLRLTRNSNTTVIVLPERSNGWFYFATSVGNSVACRFVCCNGSGHVDRKTLTPAQALTSSNRSSFAITSSSSFVQPLSGIAPHHQRLSSIAGIARSKAAAAAQESQALISRPASALNGCESVAGALISLKTGIRQVSAWPRRASSVARHCISQSTLPGTSASGRGGDILWCLGKDVTRGKGDTGSRMDTLQSDTVQAKTLKSQHVMSGGMDLEITSIKAKGRVKLADDPPPSAFPGMLGLKWNAGATKPPGAKELQNDSLAVALLHKTEFTLEEWRDFDILDLRSDHFVESGDCYYTPCAAWHSRGWSTPELRGTHIHIRNLTATSARVGGGDGRIGWAGSIGDDGKQDEELVLTHSGFVFLGRHQAVVSEGGEWTTLSLIAAGVLLQS